MDTDPFRYSNGTMIDLGHQVTPEQSARMAQHFEAVNAEPTRWPSGWYIIPASIIGALMLWGLFSLVGTAIDKAWHDYAAACERGAECE